jgi:uncharacterized protein YyaL (SSP411 family)
LKTPPPGKNHLAFETSPYLLQHADNPVDWHPWGEDALAKARELGRPLLVSIGYSSCHWCHVMEHESFEDQEVAELMNELFVCVKVDREERPDVDEVCMNAIHVMGIPGGWPLNVFMTPDGRPFFGGTYFPPEGRHGRIGWPDLLRRIARLWEGRRDDVVAQAGELASAVAALAEFTDGGELPEAALFERAVDQIASRFDERHGGFSGAPKFPPHEALAFLVRRQVRTGGARERAMITLTLEKMARGGIADQLGGGFHRYSVDERWIVPHFEKMLYDNAQLARVYVEAHQLTGAPELARVARGTLDWLLREMTDVKGGVYSATDADSEGREGVYFTWTKSEIARLLGPDAAIFSRAYGVTEEGNFEDVHHPRRAGEEGMNVLHVVYTGEEIAKQEGTSAAEVEERLARARRKLLEVRGKRTPPGLDDKVVTSWNGLAIGAFAYAGRVLGEPRYVEAARRAAELVEKEMRAPGGRLLRTWRNGEAKIPAFLEDHAFLADAYLDLYEATFDPAWLRAGRSIADETNRLFADEEHGGWFHVGSDTDSIVTRGKTPVDSSTPSANGIAARVMIRLAKWTGDEALRVRAERAIRVFQDAMERSPAATLALVSALDLFLHDDGEIAIAGDPGAEAIRPLLAAVHQAYRPGAALALRDPVNGEEHERVVPWLRGKTLVEGAPAVYLCRNHVCQAPITDARELERALAGE